MGEVQKAIQDKELNHLKTLLEREAVVRSAKHLINAELRETSDTHLSAVVAHLLNLLVAPLPLIAKLDDGSIQYPSQTTTSVAAQETKPQAAAESESKPAEEGKKSKKNKKKDADKQASSKAPADLGEMFLKQSAASGETQPFAVEGLFIDPAVFKGLLPLEEPSVLKMKPAEFYAKIGEVAQIRYGIELPQKQSELRCLQHANTKLALLRDLCLKVGIKLMSHANRDFVLDNDVKVVLDTAQRAANPQ